MTQICMEESNKGRAKLSKTFEMYSAWWGVGNPQVFPPEMLDVPYKYMVVSINGTPNSWMIYNGTPILGNHHMLVYWRLTIYNFRVVDVFRTRKCVNNSFIYSTRFSTSFHFIVLQLLLVFKQRCLETKYMSLGNTSLFEIMSISHGCI